MIEFLRDFVGVPPVINSLNDIGSLFEYIFGACVFIIVLFSIYALIGNLISFFRR